MLAKRKPEKWTNKKLQKPNSAATTAVLLPLIPPASFLPFSKGFSPQREIFFRFDHLSWAVVGDPWPVCNLWQLMSGVLAFLEGFPPSPKFL